MRWDRFKDYLCELWLMLDDAWVPITAGALLAAAMVYERWFA